MLHAGVCLQEPPAVQDGLCAGCCAHGAGGQILQVAELHASAEAACEACAGRDDSMCDRRPQRAAMPASRRWGNTGRGRVLCQ